MSWFWDIVLHKQHSSFVFPHIPIKVLNSKATTRYVLIDLPTCFSVVSSAVLKNNDIQKMCIRVQTKLHIRILISSHSKRILEARVLEKLVELRKLGESNKENETKDLNIFTKFEITSLGNVARVHPYLIPLKLGSSSTPLNIFSRCAILLGQADVASMLLSRIVKAVYRFMKLFSCPLVVVLSEPSEQRIPATDCKVL